MFFIFSEIRKDVGIQKRLTSIHIDNWIKEDVFKLRWWLLIAFILISIFIWWYLLDKSRAYEICLYVALAAIFALGVREYGEELTLWDYPTDIIPIFPPLTSINLIILPLMYSLIYQYFSAKKSFLWATLIATAIFCFILEPLFSLGGLYQLIHWKYYFSFPLYALMAIFIRVLVIKINSITKDYRHQQ
jgi:hypothetical protein